MPELVLSHNGYTLRLVFPNASYYVKREFEPGKTLFQILFEHLVDGKSVPFKELACKYKKVNPDLTAVAINLLMSKIELGIRQSPNQKLRKMLSARPSKNELLLKHKGHELLLSNLVVSYHVKTQLEPGKNLHQILFEHFIDGKTVSCGGLARKYRGAENSIDNRAVRYAMKKIENAAIKSGNPVLKAKRFVRLHRGGAAGVTPSKTSKRCRSGSGSRPPRQPRRHL